MAKGAARMPRKPKPVPPTLTWEEATPHGSITYEVENPAYADYRADMRRYERALKLYRLAGGRRRQTVSAWDKEELAPGVMRCPQVTERGGPADTTSMRGRPPASSVSLLIEARYAVESGYGARLREAANLSQSDLARLLKVAPSAVSRWEARQRVPREKQAVAYARLLRHLAELVAV